MSSIKYRKGYRYQLAEAYEVETGIPPVIPSCVDVEYLRLDGTGHLLIRAGYAWDGASGPAVDTPSIMRGALVHDACYQLLRLGFVDHTYRKNADEVLGRLCREDGMSRLRAWYVVRAVRWFGGPSADPASERPVLTAP